MPVDVDRRFIAVNKILPQKPASAPAITIGLVGVGGYGHHFVSTILGANARPDVRLVAAADPNPQASLRYTSLVEHGIPLYPSIDHLYAEHRPELVVIASPIHLHCEQTVTALSHGSHVLCEKPLCSSAEQIIRMTEARNRARRQVAIGYQLPFSPVYQALKADIMAGVFGRPIRLSSLCSYVRGGDYFVRNSWAGRQHNEAGHAVFDSPLNNACAHFLHIMLYLLGDRPDSSAFPSRVTAELYRANAIENYDTAFVRCDMKSGAQLMFITSHCTGRDQGPVLRFEFENATITFDNNDGRGVVAHFPNGRMRTYGIASVGTGKLWKVVSEIREGRPTCCGIEAAAAHTCTMLAAQRSEIHDFGGPIIQVRDIDGSAVNVVQGLADAVERCFQESKLPAELDYPWARPAFPVCCPLPDGIE